MSSSTMVVKRKPSRKEKRLQKKLKRLEEELSSEDEDGQEKAQQRQASKKSSLQDTARAAGPTHALDSTEYHDDKSDDEKEDIDGGSDASSSSGVGQEGDESDAGMESFDEDVGGREDDEVMSDGSRGEGPTRPDRGQKDGMADVMARILNQQVNKKAPVLAKRRTALMKEMEEEKKARARAKTAAERKRAALNHQLYVPDHTDAEKERQLKRIATRGVVALFNAVTKARQAQEEKGGGSGPGKAKDMSKKEFLEMLKSSTSNSRGMGADGGPAREKSGGGGNPFMDEFATEGKAEREASWAAIQDDYLMKAPKIDDYSEGEEEMEGPGLMGGSEEE